MSHYDKQGDKQLAAAYAEEARDRKIQEAIDEAEKNYRSISMADYDHFIDGTLILTEEQIDTLLSSMVKANQSYGLYDDSAYIEEDLDTYMEPEFYDFVQVLKMGAEKHGNKNWLSVDGKKSSHKDMHTSMFRHLAKSYANQRLDEESGLDHLLHLASRSLMVYTLLKRGITHKEDL